MLNSVVKISKTFAKYSEYYTIILGAFFRGHAVVRSNCGIFTRESESALVCNFNRLIETEGLLKVTGNR